MHSAHPTPSGCAHPACCRTCSSVRGCVNPQCRCHQKAAAPPDLESLAEQVERSRAFGPGAFSIACLAFFAGLREAVDAAVRERAS